MRTVVAALLVVLAAAVASPAAAQEPYTPQMREWTSRVGRMLHGYHAALDVATAAVREKAGADALPPLHAGGPYDDGWAFSFGDLEGDSVFVIRYGAIMSGSGAVARLDEFAARRVASPHHTQAARALARVRADFEAIRREQGFHAPAYRFAVLPFPQGGLTAFVSPAQTRPGVTLAGNDLMYRLARQEGRILERTRFHHRVVELPLTPPPGGTAVLMVPQAPGPSPVDVLHAMERRAPLLVLGEHGVFLVAPDGTVTLLPEDDPRARTLRSTGTR